MMPFHRRVAILLPALMLEAFVVEQGNWKAALAIALPISLIAGLKARSAVGVTDLFDRTTVYFGAVAGILIGQRLAEGLNANQPPSEAIESAFFNTAGAIFLLVLTASFLIRGALIRRSLRTGYFR